MRIGYLVDTNVLVYAYDPSAPDKQERAIEVLGLLAEAGFGALSSQVLAEFFVIATRKIPNPLSLEEAERSVSNYLRSWPVFDLTGLIVAEAIRGVCGRSLSYWDAQIWATAKLNQIPRVLTEDFAGGSTIEGVTFVNPFEPQFSLKSLVPDQETGGKQHIS